MSPLKIKTHRVKGVDRERRKKNNSKMKVDNGGVKRIQGDVRRKDKQNE